MDYIFIGMGLGVTILATVLLIGMLMTKEKDQHLENIMSLFVALIVLVFSNVLALIFRNTNYILALIMVNISFFASYIWIYFYHKMTIMQLEKTSKGLKQYDLAVKIAFTVVCLLWFSSNWTGLFFTYDISGTFAYSRFHFLSQAVGVVIVIIDATIALINRRRLGIKRTFSIVSIILFLIFCIPIDARVKSSFPIYLAMSMVSVFFYIFLYQEQEVKMKNTMLQLEKMEREIMISQFQPRFVVNILTTLTYVLDSDSELAKNIAKRFTVFFRNNIELINSNKLIPFSVELENIENYIELEKIRFGDKLNVDFDKIEITDFEIPVLTLLPFVENAINHGISKKMGGGTLYIETKEKDGQIVLIIKDDGTGFDVESLTLNSGIMNNIRRYQLLTNNQIEIFSEPGLGTKITIYISPVE